MAARRWIAVSGCVWELLSNVKAAFFRLERHFGRVYARDGRCRGTLVQLLDKCVDGVVTALGFALDLAWVRGHKRGV